MLPRPSVKALDSWHYLLLIITEERAGKGGFGSNFGLVAAAVVVEHSCCCCAGRIFHLFFFSSFFLPSFFSSSSYFQYCRSLCKSFHISRRTQVVGGRRMCSTCSVLRIARLLGPPPSHRAEHNYYDKVVET